jgi:hypothetical protein
MAWQANFGLAWWSYLELPIQPAISFHEDDDKTDAEYGVTRAMLLACPLAASDLSELTEAYTAAGHALTTEYDPLLADIKENTQNLMTSGIDRLPDSGAADELYIEAQEALIIFHDFELFEHSPAENYLEKLLDMLKTIILMATANN